MLIRPATIADLPAITELERKAATAAHWSAEQYGQLLKADPHAPATRLALVAVPSELSRGSSQNILGFLVARGLGPEWEMENLVVQAEARRKGVGKSLMKEFVRRAQAAGGQFIFLEVRESNAAARTLYRCAGFEEAGRRKAYYAGPVEDAVVYKLSLEGA
jgi:ribosomal-protein-alanine N-acetyltransferase